MLGVNPSAERQKEDFYATDPKALKIFIEKLGRDNIKISKNVWECACGMGHLADVLIEDGHNVKKTDIVDRGCKGTIVSDFLEEENKFDGDILTNPPFKTAEKFVDKGVELLNDGNKLYLFLKIQFLEGQRRKKMFEINTPKYVYIYSARQLCCKDGEFHKYSATTQCYAWYVWEKGYEGETIIRWI